MNRTKVWRFFPARRTRARSCHDDCAITIESITDSLATSDCPSQPGSVDASRVELIAMSRSSETGDRPAWTTLIRSVIVHRAHHLVHADARFRALRTSEYRHVAHTWCVLAARITLCGCCARRHHIWRLRAGATTVGKRQRECARSLDTSLT